MIVRHPTYFHFDAPQPLACPGPKWLHKHQPSLPQSGKEKGVRKNMPTPFKGLSQKFLFIVQSITPLSLCIKIPHLSPFPLIFLSTLFLAKMSLFLYECSAQGKSPSSRTWLHSWFLLSSVLSWCSFCQSGVGNRIAMGFRGPLTVLFFPFHL